MCCGEVPGATIVYADEIVRGAFRVRHVTAIEQHKRNLRAIERTGDTAVSGILFVGEFKRREKYSCYFLRDERLHHLFSSLCAVLCGESGVAPQQGIGTREMG